MSRSETADDIFEKFHRCRAEQSVSDAYLVPDEEMNKLQSENNEIIRERLKRHKQDRLTPSTVAVHTADFLSLDAIKARHVGPSDIVDHEGDTRSDTRSSDWRSNVSDPRHNVSEPRHVSDLRGSRKRMRDEVGGPSTYRRTDVPPWYDEERMGKKSSTPDFFGRLHQELMCVLLWLQPTPEEITLRQRVLARVVMVAEGLWPQCQVRPFGSYFTGLFLPNSDIDICIQHVPGTPKTGLRLLAEQLIKWKFALGVEVITSARVPIVKYVDEEVGIPVDISLNQDSAQRTSTFIRDQLAKFSHLRPLIMILKLFLQQRGLGETYKGGIGSYLLFVMVLSFLQQHPVTYLYKRRRACHIGHLLYDFLQLWGSDFNLESTGLTVQNNGRYFNKIDRHWLYEERPQLVAVESPLDREVDLGKNSYNFHLCRNAFRQAHVLLTEAAVPFLKAKVAPTSLLETFFNLKSPLFWRNPKTRLGTQGVTGDFGVPDIPSEILNTVSREMACVAISLKIVVPSDFEGNVCQRVQQYEHIRLPKRGPPIPPKAEASDDDVVVLSTAPTVARIRDSSSESDVEVLNPPTRGAAGAPVWAPHDAMDV